MYVDIVFVCRYLNDARDKESKAASDAAASMKELSDTCRYVCMLVCVYACRYRVCM
jgi:hypothetical protein